MIASLKGRLWLSLSAGLVLVWLAMMAWLHEEASEQIHALMDAHLAKSARVITAMVAHEADEFRAADLVETSHLHEIREFAHEYERDQWFWVRDPQGRLLLDSGNLAAGLPEQADAAWAQGQGFFDGVFAGKALRGFRIVEPVSGFVVTTVQPLEDRQGLIRHIEWGALAGLLLGLLPLVSMVGLVLKAGLRPLDRLNTHLMQRDVDDREAVALDGLPDELRPLVNSLNGLLQRLGTSLDAERRLTADAAHELRTPLAALKIQAQVAQRSDDAKQRQQALEKIIEGVDRSTRLVEQLMTLARVDVEPGSHLRLDDDAWLDGLLEELKTQHGVSDASLRVQGRLASLALWLDENQARALIRNLLDNALRYGGAGEAVVLAFERKERGACIRVSDHGPGVALDKRERVLQRFARGGERLPGTGLGLAIVARIVERYGQELELDWTEPLQQRGLTVRCWF